jgi:Uma2 family endonuclease
MATVGEALLTAEEFLRLPDDGVPKELVRGRVVPVNVPFPRHGQICGKIMRVLGRFLDSHDIGHLVSNDSGVVTERDPDTVRGADVAFYSYTRLPRGPLPERYVDVVPELVFEVRSPTDRWREVRAKVTEYLDAGVTTVCVLDPATQAVHAYNNDLPDRVFRAEEELTLPEVLGDFRAPVRLFFE